jgi:hypothetical protein
MFGGLFKKKEKQAVAPRDIIVIQLNARLQPMHRDEIFEDPLLDILADVGVSAQGVGGGTLMSDNGEVASADIEIEVKSATDEVIQKVITALEKLGAPKGSNLVLDSGRKIPFGALEGLGVYLNGSELPEEVYKTSDVNFVYTELERLMADAGQVMSYWDGATETAFYLYGKSADEMKARIADFLATYPLCHRCRVQQIA